MIVIQICIYNIWVIRDIQKLILKEGWGAKKQSEFRENQLRCTKIQKRLWLVFLS